MRVLIVKMSAMGDVLHALPVLSYLHAAHPGIEIDWVVEEAFADLLAGQPLISMLHRVRFKQWKKQPFASQTQKEIRSIASSLAARAYDVVFDIQGNIKSGIVTRITGCPLRYGFTADTTQERFNILCTNRRVRILSEDYHITDQYLRVVSSPFELDFTNCELETQIVTSAADDAWAAEFVERLGADQIMLCHMGTTWETKFWHEAGWIDLGRRMAAAFPQAVQLYSWGSPDEQQSALRVVQAVGPCARSIDRMPLQRLAALLKQVGVVLGGDTGVVHLAAAVGTPTVSYYRSSDGARSGPRGGKHRVIQAPMPCTRCFKTRCERDSECRTSIGVEMLFDAVSRQLR